MLGDPLRADCTELIVVHPCATDNPRHCGNNDGGGDTTASDQDKCEHGAESIWRTREDFNL